MINFAVAYKNAFKKILTSYGYSLWKSLFYKDVNNEIFFFLQLRKKSQSSLYATVESGLGFFPYCIDSGEIEPLIKEGGFDMIKILQKLAPESMSKEHYKGLVNASSDEAIFISLELFSSDIVNFILPYFDKLCNLEFLYSELVDIAKGRITSYTYGLSLKIRKYEDAIIYINNEILRHNTIIDDRRIMQTNLRNGDIINHDALRSRMSDEDKKMVEKKILRNRSREEYIELQINNCNNTISSAEIEISKMLIIKEALQANEHTFLDKIVEDIENKNRDYVRQMLIS